MYKRSSTAVVFQSRSGTFLFCNMSLLSYAWILLLKLYFTECLHFEFYIGFLGYFRCIQSVSKISNEYKFKNGLYNIGSNGMTLQSFHKRRTYQFPIMTFCTILMQDSTIIRTLYIPALEHKQQNACHIALDQRI